MPLVALMPDMESDAKEEKGAGREEREADGIDAGAVADDPLAAAVVAEPSEPVGVAAAAVLAGPEAEVPAG